MRVTADSPAWSTAKKNMEDNKSACSMLCAPIWYQRLSGPCRNFCINLPKTDCVLCVIFHRLSLSIHLYLCSVLARENLWTRLRKCDFHLKPAKKLPRNKASGAFRAKCETSAERETRGGETIKRPLPSRAPSEMPRSPRLAHKAPIMQAKKQT